MKILSIFCSVLLVTSCVMRKKTTEKSYQVTDAVVHSIDGFSLIYKGLDYGIQIVNECRPMENRDFSYHCHIELINPKGKTLCVIDSLTNTSHDNRLYNIGDKRWLEVNEMLFKSWNHKGEKLNGIYQMNYKYNNGGCHFDITFDQQVNY